MSETHVTKQDREAEFWDKVINWQALAEAGTISESDLKLFHYVETADEAVEIIDNWKRPDRAGS